MAKKAKLVEKEKPSESTVYIGRPLVGLPRYTVFKGGVLPPYIEAMAAKDETIKGLIVPVSELQEARNNIKVKGHILNYFANKQITK